MASSSPSSDKLFDPIRKKWVAHTPEEVVRQALIIKMIEELSYPRELLSVERALSELPHISHKIAAQSLERRVDLVCYAKDIHPHHLLYPLIVIECKESASMKQEAKEQVIGYNYFIRAPFVAIAYPEGVCFGYFDNKKEQYLFSDGLPSYTVLMKAICHAKNYM